MNDVNLGNASLDAAVQALKGAAFGPVRLGISRPLQQDAAAAVSDIDHVSANSIRKCRIPKEYYCSELWNGGQAGSKHP